MKGEEISSYKRARDERERMCEFGASGWLQDRAHALVAICNFTYLVVVVNTHPTPHFGNHDAGCAYDNHAAVNL